MSGVIRWEDPPPPASRARGEARIAWPLVAQQLRQRPGVWAVVDEHRTSERRPDGALSARINSGRTKWLVPAGSFQATTRQTVDVWTLYVRYLGDES